MAVEPANREASNRRSLKPLRRLAPYVLRYRGQVIAALFSWRWPQPRP
jgi:hypothetical protein